MEEGEPAPADRWHKWRDLSKPMKGVLGCSGALLLAMIALVAIAPAPSPERPAPKDAPSGKEASPVAEQKQSADEKARTDWRHLYDRVLAIAAPCDEANTAAGEAVGAAGEGKIDVYAAYDRASSAEKACSAAWLQLGELEPPSSLPRKTRGELEEVLEKCQTTYFARKRSLEVMMEFLDDDQRPSVMDQYREEAQFAERGVMACVAGMMKAGLDVGAKMPES
jgi:hypothetical protein